LVQLYGPLVFRWCRQANLQDSDAADVLQEVFRAVLFGIDSFHRTQPGDSFRAWLRTITRNKVRDYLRRCGREPHSLDGLTAAWDAEETSSGEYERVTPTEVVSLIQRAVRMVRSEFEERTWQAFWRSAVDGQPTAAIAEELGISKSSVRQAKCRVLKRLREELEGLE
jgi:RNA polymerase sigma-70 factor (ECF subfamily)